MLPTEFNSCNVVCFRGGFPDIRIRNDPLTVLKLASEQCVAGHQPAESAESSRCASQNSNGS